MFEWAAYGNPVQPPLHRKESAKSQGLTFKFTSYVFCILIRRMFAMKKINDYGTGIPQNEIESLARLLLPKIQEFFASEEGQKQFLEWKSGQASRTKQSNAAGGKVIDT